MSPGATDPYRTLGVSQRASDDELRAAYRRLVQLHHPDHNGGSAESARRFEEVQAAYAQIREQRARNPGPGRARPRTEPSSPRGPVDPDVESRLANLERELREAQQVRERARRAAREAAARVAGTEGSRRPTDEELGYIRTEDSLSKILADARSELSDRVSEAREHPVARRVSELIDELASRLTGEPPKS